MIQGNIPSAASARVPENLIGQLAAKRMGCKTVRIEAGLGSMDTTKQPKFPTIALGDVLAGLTSNNLTAQWMVSGAPHNSGPITNLPDPSAFPVVIQMVQGIVDQIHAKYPDAVFEISNEPDGRMAPAINGVPIWQSWGHTRGWIPEAWFAYMVAVYGKIDWRGHKLCMHLVGGGQAAQKVTATCFNTTDGLKLIKLIQQSGGFVAWNTYPNQTLAWLSSPAGFAGHFLNYTWPNTVAVHKASGLGVLPCKIGETGVKETLLLFGAKLHDMRQALFSGILNSRLDATCFAIVTTDPASQVYAICKEDGSAVIKDLVLA